jgi:hypothetical protein
MNYQNLQADYLVVGSGAVAMALVDVVWMRHYFMPFPQLSHLGGFLRP